MNKTTDSPPPRPVVSMMSEPSSLRPPPTSPTLAKPPKARNNHNNDDTEKAMLSHVKKAADDSTNTPSKTHKHRKSSSLVGFDPFLATSVEQELSATSAAAASTTPAPTTKTTTTTSRPPLNKGVWGSDQDVFNMDHPLLGKPPSSSGSRRHRKSAQTMCATDLRDIAAELSHDKPPKSTDDEEQRMQELMTNITLGTTIDDSKLSARPPRTHRKTQSLASVEEYLMSKLKNPRNNMTSMKTARVPTPPPSSAASSAQSSPVTPDQRRGGGNNKMMRGAAASPGSTTSASNTTPVSSPKPTTPFIPTLSKPSPTSFLKDSNTLALKSSEAEPSLHQMEIPSASEAYLYARLCQLLEEYHDEDFKNLAGKSLLQLNGFVNLGKKIDGLVEQVHKPIAKLLLQMNVVVEGYLVDKQHLSEVAVFSTSSHIIVVYRGATNRQNKPMSKKYKQNAAAALDQEHPNVLVFEPFRDAYFGLEHKVQVLLDRLSDENPFAEVVFTGWSFGAALSTLAGARFASSRPMTRFECCVYSSPKVGQLEWRMYVHSLPNLKVMRVEIANDPNVVTPMDSTDCKWRHCGHALAINGAVGVPGKQPPPHPIIAYRFDNHKKAAGVMDSVMKLNILQQKHNNIDNYVTVIGEFQDGKLSWVDAYAGEDIGEGVVGKDKEKRNVT